MSLYPYTLRLVRLHDSELKKDVTRGRCRASRSGTRTPPIEQTPRPLVNGSGRDNRFFNISVRYFWCTDPWLLWTLRHVLWVYLDAVFNFFSARINCPFTGARVLIFVARWCHNFREIPLKNCKKSKNLRTEKLVRTTSYS